MSKPTSIFPALLLLAFTLLVAGCGSGDGDTLTKAEFVEQADALCRKIDRQQAGEFAAYGRKNAKDFNRSPEKGLEKAILELVVPSVRNEIKEVKALGVPEDDEAQVEEFFAEVEAALKKTGKDPLSIENGRPKNPFFGSFKLGQAYGFNDCSEMS
jgi:hypothetical protein